LNSFALLLVLVWSAFGPRGDGGLKQYVQKLNGQTAKAYETKDSGFFDRLYGPEFQSKDEHGVVMKRKESLFVVRFQLNTIKFTDCRVATQAIKLEKARGTVVTKATMLGLTPARRGRPATQLRIARKWSDVFEKRGDKWELVSRTELAPPVVLATPLTPAKPRK